MQHPLHNLFHLWQAASPGMQTCVEYGGAACVLLFVLWCLETGAQGRRDAKRERDMRDYLDEHYHED